MKIFYAKTILVILICLSSAVGTLAWADGVKERMLHRQPAILKLKNQGIIGETNTGYLGFVTAKHAGEAIVSAENADRRSVYAKIAHNQNLSVDLVGRRRALQLIERAAPGQFYQNRSGAWVRK